MNEEDPKKFAWYLREFRGAIIGGIVALVLIATGLSYLLINLVIIAVCMVIGYYIQNNKDKVKEVLRNFIDRV